MIVKPGARIDRYEILRAVASGGMGTVWLAKMSGKHGFAKRVAVKTIRADLAAYDRARAMFLDEARIAMRIEHAHVAQVLDVGERDGTLYIVLEWIEGVSLEHLCAAAGSTLPVAHVLRIASDACEGLDAAHELRDDAGADLGLVHRDVSPDNILISRAGIAKIIDFGIAKVRDRLAGETDAGIVRGKRAYMSPEHVAGRPLDRRADIWAMGATIYRALVGHPPFDEPEAHAAYLDRGEAPVMPPELSPAIRDVVLRALAVSPGDRWQTAADLQRALEHAMTTAAARVTSADVAARFADLLVPTYEDQAPAALPPTVPASPAARASVRRRSRRVVPAIVLVAALSIGIVAWRAGGSSAPSESSTTSPVAGSDSTAGSDAGSPGSSAAINESSSHQGSGSSAPSASVPPRLSSSASRKQSPRFVADDAVSYRDRGEWRDAIVEGINRDGKIAIHVLGATRSQRDVDASELRPRKRLAPLPVGQTVRVGKVTCTVAEHTGIEDYMLACPFGQQLHAQRSALTIVP